MANHKRGRPKNARAGCLSCKPHKMNGAPSSYDTVQEKKNALKLDEGLQEVVESEAERINTPTCPCGDPNC